MSKLIIKILAVVCLVFALIITVNFKIDKYGYFQGGVFERSLALQLLDGEEIQSYNTTLLNEREIMRLYIQNMDSGLGTAVLGSSRALQITKDYSQTPNSFFNFGVSGGEFRDMLTTFYLMDKQDKLPKNLILVLDPWILSSAPEATSSRADAELFKEFLTTRLGYTFDYEKPDYTQLAEVLISPSIFQENLKFYFYDKTNAENPDCINDPSYTASSDCRLADGSQLYNTNFTSLPQDEIDLNALTLINNSFYRLEGFENIDADLQQQFEKFIIYAQSKNINITFVLMPYHPLVYDGAIQSSYRFPAFFDMEDYFLTFAHNHNIPIYGSYDPLVAGCDNADFYDGLHVRRESITDFFIGLPGSKIYKQYTHEAVTKKSADDSSSGSQSDSGVNSNAQSSSVSNSADVTDESSSIADSSSAPYARKP